MVIRVLLVLLVWAVAAYVMLSQIGWDQGQARHRRRDPKGTGERIVRIEPDPDSEFIADLDARLQQAIQAEEKKEE